MTKAKLATLLVAAGGLWVAATPALAHHSFAAEYDQAKPVHLDGTCTKVEWMNPHARFYMDVKDASGTVTNWEFELGSPNGLARQGWRRDTLKPGDQISVDGFLAKDGSHLANARTVKTVDGKRLFAGSATDGGPQSTPGGPKPDAPPSN